MRTAINTFDRRIRPRMKKCLAGIKCPQGLWSLRYASDSSILFFEDIPEFCNEEYMAGFFDWLGSNGYLQVLSGVIIGKMRMEGSFRPYADRIREIVSGKYRCPALPVMGALNFGHTSPVCILPYGAEAEINVDELTFTILESGVI